MRLAQGELLGDAADFAAKVATEAAPGEVWLTAAAQAALAGGAPAEEVGERTLEGCAEPVRLFRLRAPAGSSAFGDEVSSPQGHGAFYWFGRGMRRALLARRRLLAACAAAASAGLLVGALVVRSPVAQAGQALAGSRPRRALELLAPEKPSPEVLLLRAQAHHALQQFDSEMAVLLQLEHDDPAPMRREEMLAHLVEHLDGPAAGRAQGLLARIGAPAVGPLAKAAVDKEPHRRWAALEVLRELGAEGRADLAASYIQDLDQRDCGVVARAAKKLGDLGDARAVGPLRDVALRKSSGLFGGVSEACEAPAARAALKKLGEGK